MEKFVLVSYDKYQRLLEKTKSPKAMQPPPGKRKEVQKSTKKDTPPTAKNTQLMKWISF